MPESSIVGTRIRERRVQRRIRQSELAKTVGISASYLNLIEHNRRRIGGKILIRLAEALEVEPALLSEGAEAALIGTLNEAAGGRATELTGAEEFAGRFTGWAQLLADLHRQNETLERTVRILTDRLAHDPRLAESLHDVISTVTAIRSTASILVDTKKLEPEWQSRFHRNINEDSRRLAKGAENLVRYLEAAPDTEAEINSPQDELHAFLSDNKYHFPALEGGARETTIEVVLEAADSLVSDAATKLARDMLRQYLRDAERLPLKTILEAVARYGMAPDKLAQALGVDMTCVFRRLATLPQIEVGPVGLVICDGSGTLILRKPLAEFAMPRVAGACAQWPLYQVLAQPQSPVRAFLRQAGPGNGVVETFTVAEQVVPASFTQGALFRAHMLILPSSSTERDLPLRDVGTNCRICPLSECPVRREPSIIAEGF